MECQASDSKKLFKVFDASKRKKSRKKREGLDDTNSVVTDESASGNMRCVASAKHSLQDMAASQGDELLDTHIKRERDSSPSVSNSPGIDVHRSSRSPRRHRRPPREGVSLALKAGLVSTPRSISPTQDDGINHLPQDQDSFIYAFLEEAIKRDKKKKRSRRHEDRPPSRDRDASPSVTREHKHHHRRRHNDDVTKERSAPVPVIDQSALIETFAKLCAQISDKATPVHCPNLKELNRSHSHKSLQCEVFPRQDYDVDQRPVRLRSRDMSRTEIPCTKIRSQDNFHDSRTRMRSPDRVPSSAPVNRNEKYACCLQYERDGKYSSKIDVVASRIHNAEDHSCREYHPRPCPTRSVVNPNYRVREPPDRREYDFRKERARQYDEEKRRYCEQKTSRSFDVHREVYEEDRGGRRTTRSDSRRKRYDDPRDLRDKRYDEPRDNKRYDERRDKYYEDKGSRDRHYSNLPSKDRRSRRNLERFEKNSVVSREDEYRERDSGLSVADESTISGRSNYLRVVKQEIAEQRESMDKMMKLWKELMRCFKGSSQSQESDKVNESAANVQESAAAQLRLWRECMRRYETVARDVGDTDARLMEEINKQRSEMAEMASMWQECLQRYRDMSNDFNNLKQQLATSESPTRGPTTPLICAEGEGNIPPAPYRLPPNYPQMGGMGGGYPGVGSPLRQRASAPPPAWWWGQEPPPRRRSSPESRASRSRERRHRKDRDESRYKEKSSKPSAARSEHRHRKR